MCRPSASSFGPVGTSIARLIKLDVIYRDLKLITVFRSYDLFVHDEVSKELGSYK